MTAALFADYVTDLKVLLDEIDSTPENFRSFDLHIDLAHKGLLFVYETRRKLGQTDSIYYARMAKTGANKQVSQKTAYDAVSAFLGLGQFLALSGNFTGADGAEGTTVEGDYPTCAIAFTYRRTGMPKARSMRLIFLGFSTDEAAVAHAERVADTPTLIDMRPFHSDRVWEWK
ncbi:hypothetical protein [Rhizobium sp. HT1-10]|uniref:hypothetical protein n=1 Tax=Rhizobium sp. HT1-10 TaxID=3111638 RepID=UPI003C22681A